MENLTKNTNLVENSNLEITESAGFGNPPTYAGASVIGDDMYLESQFKSPTKKGSLLENDLFVQVLRRAVKDSAIGLREVPRFLKQVLKRGCWKNRIIEQSGRVVQFDRFEDFITAPPLDGMGTTVDILCRICADDTEALDLLNQALQKGHKGNHKTKTVKTEIKFDNDAVIKEGFKKKSVTIPLEPKSAANILYKAIQVAGLNWLEFVNQINKIGVKSKPKISNKDSQTAFGD